MRGSDCSRRRISCHSARKRSGVSVRRASLGQQRAVVVAQVAAEPCQAADRARRHRERQDEQRLRRSCAADHDGGLRPRQRADVPAPGGKPVEGSGTRCSRRRCSKLPPFRLDGVELMVDCNVDRRLRRLRGIARAWRRRDAIRAALVDDERVGHSTAFFEDRATLANKPQQSVGRRDDLEESGTDSRPCARETNRSPIVGGWRIIRQPDVRATMLNPSLTAKTYHLRLQGPGDASRALRWRHGPHRFQPPALPRHRRQRPYAAHRAHAAAWLRRARSL